MIIGHAEGSIMLCNEAILGSPASLTSTKNGMAIGSFGGSPPSNERDADTKTVATPGAGYLIDSMLTRIMDAPSAKRSA